MPLNPNFKRKFFRFLKVAMILYLVSGIALYYLQDRLLFRPEKLDKDHKYDFNAPFSEVNIPFDEASNINIIQFKTNTTPARGVVLYFHGNRDNIGRYAKHAVSFTRNSYEVWMIDYPGYGKSTGERTEQILYDWSLVFYKLARVKFSPGSIVLYGRSLGSGIAAQLASVRDCKHLVLETPYYDFPSVIRQYAPVYPLNNIIRYRIPTYEYLQKVTAPVTIFHGTSDGVIRYSNGKKLSRYLKPGDEFVSIEGGSHNDLATYRQYQLKLDSILMR